MEENSTFILETLDMGQMKDYYCRLLLLMRLFEYNLLDLQDL